MSGRYTITIKYGGDEIPYSPFRIHALPTGDASKCLVTGRPPPHVLRPCVPSSTPHCSSRSLARAPGDCWSESPPLPPPLLPPPTPQPLPTATWSHTLLCFQCPLEAMAWVSAPLLLFSLWAEVAGAAGSGEGLGAAPTDSQPGSSGWQVPAWDPASRSGRRP